MWKNLFIFQSNNTLELFIRSLHLYFSREQWAHSRHHKHSGVDAYSRAHAYFLRQALLRGSRLLRWTCLVRCTCLLLETHLLCGIRTLRGIRLFRGTCLVGIPFKFGVVSLFNLITAVFISVIGHFWSRTEAVFNSVNGDFSKTTLTCFEIFHFNFQDFLSKSQTNFEVIIVILNFLSLHVFVL